MAKVSLVALQNLRRPGGGPRIEKDSVFEADEERADELVRKRKARYNEAKRPSKTKPAGPTTLKRLTKEELYEKAQDLEIEGRSTMSKGELLKAVENAE